MPRRPPPDTLVSGHTAGEVPPRLVSEGGSTTTHTSSTSGYCWWWGSGVCSGPREGADLVSSSCSTTPGRSYRAAARREDG
jgi:hypothetical protein